MAGGGSMMDPLDVGKLLVDKTWEAIPVNKRKEFIRRCGLPQRSRFSRISYSSIDDFSELMRVYKNEEEREVYVRTLPLLQLVMAVARAVAPEISEETFRSIREQPPKPGEIGLAEELAGFKYEDIPDIEGGE